MALHPIAKQKMVILLRLVSLLFAVTLIIVVSSLLAVSHAIPKNQLEPRTNLELITSSNYTQTKNHQKRQSYFNQGKPASNNIKRPFRDSKHNYVDETERDNYVNNDDSRHKQPVYETIDQEQNFSASAVPVYRSRYHHSDGGMSHTPHAAPPIFMGFPDMGFSYGNPGSVGGVGHGFGGNPVGGGAGGHALGHGVGILDPLFLMITLSFILFLVHSILGLVDRVRLPVVRARMDDSTADNEMLDQMLYELKEAFNKHGSGENSEKIKKKV